MSVWYIVIFFAGSVQIERMDSKSACEDIKLAVTQEYGRGSSFVSAKCVSVDGVPGPKK